MKVLVIEDNPTELKLITAVLSSGGHRVRRLTSAEEVTEEIQRHKPDLILLDLRLPGMHGLDLARLLKSQESTREIPIVAVTSDPEGFTQEAALKAGCAAYIVKPIDTRSLNDRLARTLIRPVPSLGGEDRP